MYGKQKAAVSIFPAEAETKQLLAGNVKRIADLPLAGNLQTLSAAHKCESLQTISMEELYDTAYLPKTPVMEGFLYNGIYLFVGAPKIGKSFLMAQLGYHISRGIPLWGYQVHQGTVLYLALEDDYSRLQKRLSRMFGMEVSDNFFFATRAKTLECGLERQLVDFVTRHQDVRLIIIDTLQKIREIGGERYSYGNDYEIVAKLKAFSDYYGVCLLVVHHTRKMESADSFDMISGTNGLFGAADGAFVMQKEKRTENRAVLEASGRDHQDQRLILTFNRQTCIWELIDVETELWKEPKDPLLDEIKNVVADVQEWTGTATELLQLLNADMQANVLTRKLNICSERLLSEYGIHYENKRYHNGRMIKLSKQREKRDDM